MKLHWCCLSYLYIVSLFSRASAWISILYLALHVLVPECKKTNKYLTFGALIYSWYPAMYVDFIAFCSNYYFKRTTTNKDIIKPFKLHLLQEWQCVRLRWQPLRGSYCGRFVGTSSLQLGRLVKVDCIKLVTVAILGPSIRFTTIRVLSRWG
jgi:hypothetical protein